jgi:hypothetical protein
MKRLPAELYIYYKLPAAQAEAALAALQPAWAALQTRWPQLQSRLLQRDESSADGLQTWMEIHRPAPEMPQDWAQDLAALAEVLAPFLAGGRHVERFRAL